MLNRTELNRKSVVVQYQETILHNPSRCFISMNKDISTRIKYNLCHRTCIILVKHVKQIWKEAEINIVSYTSILIFCKEGSFRSKKTFMNKRYGFLESFK